MEWCSKTTVKSNVSQECVEYENFDYIRNIMWPRVTLWTEYLNELIDQFDSEEEFKSRWQDYQKQEHKFLRANLLEEPDIIINHFSIISLSPG